MFARMLTAALLAVTAENILFSGGAGFSRVFRTAREFRSVWADSVLVTFFSLASAFCWVWLGPLLPSGGPERTAALAGVSAVVCAAVSFAARLFLPKLFLRFGQHLASCAVNTVVLFVPYALEGLSGGAAAATGFALGTGLSYFLASAAVYRASPLCRNPDMPEAFSGLPAMLVYVGILSMAFAGFTGGRIF